MKSIGMKSWRTRVLCGGSVIALTAGVGLATGGFGLGGAGAAAGPGITGTPSPAVAALPASKPAALKLLDTYTEEGNATLALSAGVLAPIDGVNKISCPVPAGQTCTIISTVSIQEGSTTGDADNYMADASELDGSQFDGLGGAFNTVAPADGSYAGGTWTETQPGVTPGKHKVQTFGYSSDGATLYYYTITYQLYQG
jgi:hypothetical protein